MAHRAPARPIPDCLISHKDVVVINQDVPSSPVCMVVIPGIGACHLPYIALARLLNLHGLAVKIVIPHGYGNRDGSYGAVVVADTIVLTLDALRDEHRPLLWAGHSAGFAAAIMAAAKLSSQTAGITAICGDQAELNRTFSNPLFTLRYFVKWARLRILLWWFRGHPREALLKFLESDSWLPKLIAKPMVAKPAGLSQEARKLLVRHCCHESGADLFWANAKQLHYGWLAKLVTKPVLFIIGDRDPLRDRSRRHSFQALIRRYGSIIVVRETVLKECGHMPNVECPDRLAKAMVDFARELGYTFTAPAA